MTKQSNNYPVKAVSAALVINLIQVTTKFYCEGLLADPS